MSQIIVYTNKKSDGFEGIAVCTPTDESKIDAVLLSDCPEGAIVIDDSELPQGDDVNYFDAWQLVDGKVTVNQDKKTEIQNAKTHKETALNKLMALGLTEEEATALGV